MFFELALLGCILQGAQAACVIDIETGTQQTTKCKTDKCDVTIGTDSYCSQCSKNDDHLIDGKCVTTGTSGAADKCTANNAGACKSCGANYFLYKGGCYQRDGSPGSTICKTPGSNNGICQTCKDGYFKNPSAANNKQSCIACGDTSIIDGITGVDGCTACSGPTSAGSQEAPKTTTCSACSPDAQKVSRIVKTEGDSTSCVTEAQCTGTEGFFVKTNDNTKTCVACNVNCKTCSGAAGQCTSCKTDTPYLKKADNSQTGTCVDAKGCTNGNKYYADDADPRTCKACAEGTFEGCDTCEKSTEGAVVCKTCGSQKKIRPDKKGCIDACPPDVSTEKNGVCECVEGYAPSADGSSCASASANKSGLSTGAIAGISVAAVVVVGGLVGFLCWWFICRGKA